MLTPEQATKKAYSSPQFGGQRATFVFLDNQTGLKYYRLKEMRDNVYALQKELAEHGIAPRVYGKIDFPMDGGIVYGLITETIAELGFDLFKSLKTIAVANGVDNDTAARQSARTVNDIGSELVWAARKAGFDAGSDMHDENWGLDKNGKPLIIDFDHVYRN